MWWYLWQQQYGTCLYTIFAIGKMPVYKHLGKNSKTEEQKKEELKKKEEEETTKKRREEMDAEIQKKVCTAYYIVSQIELVIWPRITKSLLNIVHHCKFYFYFI